jgi:class 3 adenylate cyclase
MAGPVAERRMVTVLFADLVGFTTLSEGRDSEAVRELLSRYFDIARDVIERYGGTVEKFIGDAVMAVWGAPIAHEDDAERGVRAGLELVDAIRAIDPGLQARAGVLTGEAAVTLGATNQGMVAGDLVNTASRLQSAAAPGTVLVGEATQHAAAGAIAFEPAGEHHLKGKDAPVAAWVALRVVAQRRGLGRGDRLEAPFVGRDAELRLLKDLFHATSREGRVRLVSITGVAGIGKSRLAWEFLKYVDGVVEPVLWHEGRSPSYGEGVTFWALGEMVRSRARLVETDDDETTRLRVGEMLDTYVPDPEERRRIEPALLALLGVGAAPAGGAEGLFSAWRTFFERLAASQVVALVFEDLHWADSGTLDFIDHVLEWSRNVPILIITLARPDLLEARPGWGAGRRNFLALDVEPLPDAAMHDLLTGLIPGLPAAATASIIARADGIPLYAVETIRMLLADGRLLELDDGTFQPAGDLGELAVPDTLHALIAARLDSLEPMDRSLIADASVLGQSFTVDGLAALAGLDRAAVDIRLRPLVRREIVQLEVDPRSPERGMYTFVQALIREVAYATLAMRDRRSKHLAAAAYFEGLADDELAGALAAHYVAAYRAAADGPEGEAVATQARLALTAAADRAVALGSPGQAVVFLEQALQVATDDAQRADLLDRAGTAATNAARTDLADGFLARSIAIRERLGDRAALVNTILLRAAALVAARRREEAVVMLRPVVADLGELADDPIGVQLIANFGRYQFLTHLDDGGLAATDRALAASERLGLVNVAAETLATKGAIAVYAGRHWEARALLEGARVLALENGLVDAAQRASGMLASTIALDDPAASVALERENIAMARRLGRRDSELTSLGNASEDARRTGEWTWSIEEIGAALQLDIDESSRLTLEGVMAFFEIMRGRMTDDELAALVAQLRTLDDVDVAAGAHDLEAIADLSIGDFGSAHDHWLQVGEMSDLNRPYVLPRAANAAVLAGDVGAARSALGALDALGTRGRAVDADREAIRGGIAAMDGDPIAALEAYRSAISAWRTLALPWDEALTTLSAVHRIGADAPGVREWVENARAIYRRLDAAPMLTLLDEAVARSPGGSVRGLSGADQAAPSSVATDPDPTTA